MGVTSKDIDLLEEIIIRYRPKNVMELGAQNNYAQPKLPAPYMSEWYASKGIKYQSIDMSAENNCVVLDLSKPIDGMNKNLLENYDLVTDFGTSEHVGKNGKHDIESYYNCWKSKWDLAKTGGIIISENPKKGNWPGHGFNYVDMEFYKKLQKLIGFEILLLEEHAAMGNVTDGWNVICVLIHNGLSFIPLDAFKTLGVETK